MTGPLDVAERVGLLRPSWPQALRARRSASSKIAPGDFVEPSALVHTPMPPHPKGLKTGPLNVAERVGFEPTCRFYPTIRFRVGAVMTASVPLRMRCRASRPCQATPFSGLVF